MLKLYELRKNKLNLTQDEFAKKFNIKRSMYNRYENGLTTPSVELLLQISNTFNVSLDELCGNDKELAKRAKEVQSLKINDAKKAPLEVAKSALAELTPAELDNMQSYIEGLKARYQYHINNDF